jgi:hypothetical protein
MTAVEWLRANGYEDVADLAESVIAGLRAEGNKTRRDWFQTCAGGKGGKPRIVAGREFPVIRAFQVRQGLPVTPNAISKRRGEVAPPIEKQERWAAVSAKRHRRKQKPKNS